MSDSTIGLDEPGTIDKRLDTEQLTVSATTVQRERIQIAGAADTEIVRVEAAVPGLTDEALVVQDKMLNRTASGALGALNAAVTIDGQGSGTINWEIDAGTLVGTVDFEATLDDTNWFAVDAIQIDGTIITNTSAFADRGAITSTGYSQVRLRVSAYTSGTSNARMEMSQGASVVRMGDSLPAGTNNIGDVDIVSLPNEGQQSMANSISVAVASDQSSITIDNAAIDLTGGGTEAGAQRVTIANDSTGLLSIDDNGASITVDAPAGTPVAVRQSDGTAVQTFSELDLDSGAGTVNRISVGVAGAASGGPVAIEGTAANGLEVDVTRLPDEGQQTMASSISVAVASDQSSLTIDNAAIDLTGGGVEAGAQRVTIANDSTGLLSVDDNGGALTVDALNDGSLNVQIGDGTDTALVTAAGELNVSAVLTAGTANVGDVDVASITPVTATGTMTAVSQSVAIDVGGYGSVGIQLSGTWTATVGFDATVDGTNWVDLQVTPPSGTTPVITSTANGIWYADVGGFDQIRVFTDAFTSGTVQADLQSNVAGGKTPIAVDVLSMPNEGQQTMANSISVAIASDQSSVTIDNAAIDLTGGGTEAGAQRVTIANDSTGLLSVDDNGGALTVDALNDGSLNVQIGDGTSTVPVLATQADARANTTNSLTVDNFNYLFNGTTWDRALEGNVAGSALVDVSDDAARLLGVIDSATNPLEVVGDVAHDIAAAGNPVLVAARANANEPAAVADADATYLWADQQGRLVTTPSFPSVVAVDSTHGPKTLTKSTTAIEDLVVAPGAGQSIYVTSLSASNTSSTKTRLDTSDGATIRDSMMLAADGGGFVKEFKPAWKITANTALRVALSAANEVRINCMYYVAP